MVTTHSTFIEGLLPILKKLARNEGIKTVTPGIIKSVRGKREGLKISISCKLKGGFKLIVRRGKSSQEVFVITKMEETELKSKINEAIIK